MIVRVEVASVAQRLAKECDSDTRQIHWVQVIAENVGRSAQSYNLLEDAHERHWYNTSALDDASHRLVRIN